VAVGEPGGEKGSTGGRKGGDIGGGKGGGIKGGTGGSIGGGISRGLLFKRKEGFAVSLFLGCLRPRPFSPRLRNAVLPVGIIRLKKGLIKNKTRIYNNAKKVRPGYANKIKYQNNI